MLGFRQYFENTEPSCIRGEWIYYPNGKLQNAIRDDISRGHNDLIYNYYVTKYKKKFLEFSKALFSDPCVNQEKVKKAVREFKDRHIYADGLWLPPEDKTDIDRKNFRWLWLGIHEIFHGDIYNDPSCQNLWHELSDKIFGRTTTDVIHKVQFHQFDERIAIKHEDVILVRSSRYFEMADYNKDKLLRCLEAICAANQRIKSPNKPNLYDQSTLDTVLHIFVVNTNQNLTIKVKDLLGSEEPQREIEVPGSHLPVDPLSKAGVMQRDISRQQWQQRTSESTHRTGWISKT